MFSSNKKQRALKEIELRRNRRETYIEPLPGNAADMKEFLMHFYRDVLFHRTMISEECNLYPNSVKVHYNEVVLQQKLISYEDFWQRYFYRTSSVERVIQELEQKDAELKQQRATSSTNPSLLPSWMMYASSSSNSPPRETTNASSPPRPSTATVTPVGASTSKVERKPVDLIPQRVLATTSSSPMDVRTEASSSSGTNIRKANFLDLLPKRKSNSASDSGNLDDTPIIMTKKPMPDPETISTQPPLVLKWDEQTSSEPLLLVDFPRQKDNTLVASSALEVANASSTPLADAEEKEVYAFVENDEDSVEMSNAIMSPEATSNDHELAALFPNPEVVPSESETLYPKSTHHDEANEDVSSFPTQDSVVQKVEPDEPTDALLVHDSLDQASDGFDVAAQKDILLHSDVASEMYTYAPVTRNDRAEDSAIVHPCSSVAAITQEISLLQQTSGEDDVPSVSKKTSDIVSHDDLATTLLTETRDDPARDHPSSENVSSEVSELCPVSSEKELEDHPSVVATIGQTEPMTELLVDVPESDRAYLSNFLLSDESHLEELSSGVGLSPSMIKEPATDPLDMVKTSIVESDPDAPFMTPPGQVSFEHQRETTAQSLVDAAFSVINPFDAILTPTDVQTDAASPSFASVDNSAFSSDSFHSWKISNKNENPFSASISLSKPSSASSEKIQHAFDPFGPEASIEHVSIASMTGPADNVSTFTTLTRASIDEFGSGAKDDGFPSTGQTQDPASNKTSNFLGFTNPFKSTLVNSVESNVPTLTNREVLKQSAGASMSADVNVLASALDSSGGNKKVPEDSLKSGSGLNFRNLLKIGAPNSVDPVVDENDRMDITPETSESTREVESVEVKQDISNVFSKPTDEFGTFSTISFDDSIESDKRRSLLVTEGNYVEVPAQAPTLSEWLAKLFPSKKRKQSMEPSELAKVEKGPPSSKLAKYVGFPESFQRLSNTSSKKPDESLSKNIEIKIEVADTTSVSEDQQPLDANMKSQVNDVTFAKATAQPTVVKAVDSDSRAPTPVTSNVDLAAMDRSGVVDTRAVNQIATVSILFRSILVVALGMFVSWVGQHPKGVVSVVDSLCGPVQLGWSTPIDLQIVAVQAEAPFWVPVAAWKPWVFRTVCGTNRTRTILKWTREKSGHYDFDLLDADCEKYVSLMKKKNVKSVSVKTEHIEIVSARGKRVLFHPVWTRQT
jgi:hypothetical protein